MLTGLRLLAFLILLPLVAAPAFAEKRVALVIGNDEYRSLAANEQLKKAVNDANTIGDALEAIGFEVTRGENLSRGEMLATLVGTADKLQQGDIAFFFFAGHGVAIDGANYLLPSDIPSAEAGGENLVKFSAVSEAMVVSELKSRGVRVAMVVLDACRNNPFSKGGTRAFGDAARGLTRTPEVETQGVFGLYSAGFGEQALDRLGDDDNNPNSVFTRVLAPSLQKPGQSLIDIAYTVNEEVARLAKTVGHQQNPAHYDQARARDIYLAGRGSERVTPPGGEANCAGAELHFETARDSGLLEALQDHVERFGNCEFASLARILIGQLTVATVVPERRTGGGAASNESGGATPAVSVDPAAVVRALATAMTGGVSIEVTFDGKRFGYQVDDLVITFDAARREGEAVVIDTLSITGAPLGSSTLTFRRTVIERPAITGAALTSPRISFLDGVIADSPRGSLESFVITDFATVSNLTAGVGAPSLGYQFRTMEAKALKISDAGIADAVTVDFAHMEVGDFVGDRPQLTKGRIERVSLAKENFPESHPFRRMGYERVAFDISWDGARDLASDMTTVRDLTIRLEDGGALSATGVLRALPRIGIVLQQHGAIDEALKAIEVQSATVRYDDASFGGRFLDTVAAEQQKTSRAELVQEAIVDLQGNLPFDPAFELRLTQLMIDFLLEPKSFDVTIAPAAPISLGVIAEIIDSAPQTLHERLNVSLGANAPQ
ncbi:MAG: caspase family protein [Propylenella sp.]